MGGRRGVDKEAGDDEEGDGEPSAEDGEPGAGKRRSSAGRAGQSGGKGKGDGPAVGPVEFVQKTLKEEP